MSARNLREMSPGVPKPDLSSLQSTRPANDTEAAKIINADRAREQTREHKIALQAFFSELFANPPTQDANQLVAIIGNSPVGRVMSAKDIMATFKFWQKAHITNVLVLDVSRVLHQLSERNLHPQDASVELEQIREMKEDPEVLKSRILSQIDLLLHPAEKKYFVEKRDKFALDLTDFLKRPVIKNHPKETLTLLEEYYLSDKLERAPWARLELLRLIGLLSERKAA